jgi:hypothetical protein
MKTLRDDVRMWLRPGVRFCPSPEAYGEYEHGVRDALRKYGSYRVVEGVLYYRSPDPQPIAHGANMVFVRTDGGDVDISPLSNTVKLLLPPEEKEDGAADLRRKLSQCHAQARDIAADCTEHRHRADKYEKALREIAGVAGETTALRRTLARIAREALDEND